MVAGVLLELEEGQLELEEGQLEVEEGQLEVGESQLEVDQGQVPEHHTGEGAGEDMERLQG